MTNNKLKIAFLTALLTTLVILTIWEIYWRSFPDYYEINVEDDRYLFSAHRAKVEKATSEEVIILGSSRTGFNFNTHVWEEVQGLKPINLTTDGKTPMPFLEDIVENTDFNGTIILGVTPPLFFSGPESGFWSDSKQWVTHYHKETYAQKLGQEISKPLQRNLLLLTTSELDFYNELDLKSLINRISLKTRIEDNWRLPKFKTNDEDRNLIMVQAMTKDQDYAAEVQAAWTTFLPTLPPYEVIAEGMPPMMNFFTDLITTFKERGGKIVFIRHKSEPEWKKHVDGFMPRDKVWDVFLEQAESPGYHFLDYPFMQIHTLPDWSHMAPESAKQYTRDMVEQLLKDGHLKSYKN